MQTYQSRTPFGARSLTLAHVAAQAKAPALERIAHKWDLFRALCVARMRLGVSERALAVLDALLSFHPETTLSCTGGAGADLIVWPSNRQLAMRAHGMPASTLRRHLATLCEAGLIVRRDSPNGKRYARKGDDGEVETAFGFDLTPLVARADEIEAIAGEIRAAEKAMKLARERITICRRDIAKMIETALEEDVPAPEGQGDWSEVHAAYRSIVENVPRRAALSELESAAARLAEIADRIFKALASFENTQNMNARESQNGRHIQNSKPESILESETGLRKEYEASSTQGETDTIRHLPKRDLPLALVLDACPDVRDMARNGDIRHWRDMLAAAEFVRPMLGVSPSAWAEARAVMGDREAAITLAAMLQRAPEIRNAGGYLRNLTERARTGAFSTWPMIMALLRARLETSGQMGTCSDGDLPTGGGRMRKAEIRLKD